MRSAASVELHIAGATAPQCKLRPITEWFTSVKAGPCKSAGGAKSSASRPQTHHGLDPAVADDRADTVLTREPRTGVGRAHGRRQGSLCRCEGLVARNHIGVIAGASDPRPTGDIRQHDRVSSENRAMPMHIEPTNFDRRMFQFRLSRDGGRRCRRSRCGADRRQRSSSTAAQGEVIGPVHSLLF